MALTRCTADLQQCAKPGSIVQSVCSTPGCNAAQDRIPSAVSPPTKIPSAQRNAYPVVVQFHSKFKILRGWRWRRVLGQCPGQFLFDIDSETRRRCVVPV